MDALKLSPCYPAFLITAEVPEVYMHQLWNTIKKIKDTDAYRFKLDKKKFRIDTKVFREVLQICPRLPNQDFVKPPSKDEIVSFIKDLSTLASVICYLRFTMIICTSLGEHLLLLSIDFMFQADNKEISFAHKENMPYLRFTKVIISHFISKDKTIFMRNRINLHTVRDDSLLGTLKFVSKTQDYHMYGALIPEEMINQDIKDSKAYKTYLNFATRKAKPKKARKFKKVVSPSKILSPVLEEEPVEKPKRAKKPAKKSTTKKAPAKVDRGKGMDLLSDVALLKAAQLKKTHKKIKLETHKLHANGSSDRVGSQPKVPDEQQDKITSTNKGTGIKPGVPNVPKDQSKSENKSWGNSEDDDSNDDDSDDVSNDDDDDADSDADGDNKVSDNEKTDYDEDENPNLNQNDDEEEE
ncbi:hypothetical protein Tco_0059672 [Tanacetum coccineum]